MTTRRATITRHTTETKIHVTLALDGSGTGLVNTGIPFLDHMLQLMAKHGCFDLTIKAAGDLDIDVHHTNEDIGIAVGAAFAKALGQKAGITRFGSFYVPMEGSLARVVLDFSGRPLMKIDYPAASDTTLRQASGGNYSRRDAEHFLESFARESRLTLHVALLSADDFHHAWEAVFKALGRALDQAVRTDRRVRGVPSTKDRL